MDTRCIFSGFVIVMRRDNVCMSMWMDDGDVGSAMSGQVQQANGDREAKLQGARIRIQETVIHIAKP